MLTPAIAYPAATLVLMRDRPGGLEVLMLKRHADTFFSGALVFPGGRVDAGDGEGALIGACRAVERVAAEAMAYRVAAIRECFEEAHILLARATGEAALMAAPALAALEDRLGGAIGRKPHFAELAASGAIELAADALVPFAHWVTPEQSPKRYDTRFFLARAPADQTAEPDGREAVAALWITPEQAIAEADAQRQRLVFATRLNLLRLAAATDVAAALAAAAESAARMTMITPEIYETPEGFRIRIPAGLGYEVFDLPTGNPAQRR